MNPIVSNFNKIRWKFEKIQELPADGIYSDKFTFDSIDWKIRLKPTNKNNFKYLAVYFHYDSPNKKDKTWICEMKRDVKILNHEGEDDIVRSAQDCYDCDSTNWGFTHFVRLSKLLSGDYIIENDAIVVEIDFSFKYYDFSRNVPNYSDFEIIVDGTVFRVNKGNLCSRVDFFYDLFVQLVIPGFTKIKTVKLDELVMFSDEFGARDLKRICEKYLMKSEKSDFEKIEYADKYGLSELLDNCLKSMTSSGDIKKKLQKNLGFLRLKDATKLSIMDRLLEIV
ncbi:unnamed protein product [Caenorhabditis angaria]|uniref:MATH domain-containing protein n=1 Tax=Caenorhabditis angaria TaxID=860376 RepID=A0A9P1MXY4_9PELO|nr:unnamed protein product [Caenorhabditis angaria]